VPAVAKEVYDVTGAGDTVISVVAAGLGAKVTLLDSVIMANRAAGETVKEIGTVSITPDALINAFI
jgi:bifunctional ADP-heptose synthase (sugar kinase/adenylyltransferase)